VARCRAVAGARIAVELPRDQRGRGAWRPATQHDAWLWISGSVPYGTVAEHGLYFVAFSADPSRYDHMLARMFATADDRLRDRLTEFSHPVSGAYYFAPSLQALNELAGPEPSSP
jgi:hypothetical protein